MHVQEEALAGGERVARHERACGYLAAPRFHASASTREEGQVEIVSRYSAEAEPRMIVPGYLQLTE
jgi:hypothetical protein